MQKGAKYLWVTFARPRFDSEVPLGACVHADLVTVVDVQDGRIEVMFEDRSTTEVWPHELFDTKYTEYFRSLKDFLDTAHE